MTNQDIIQELGEQIDFETQRVAQEGYRESWGKDYTEGYINGLEQARFVLVRLEQAKTA